MERTPADHDRQQESDPSRQRRGDRESDPTTLESGPVGALHRTVGNQAVRRRFENGTLQASLAVSQPGDPTEREAERVAKQVMRADPATAGETGERRDRHAVARASTPVDSIGPVRRTAASESAAVDGQRETQVRSLRGGGRSLPPAVRSFFEPRFGQDFGDVRVHTGRQADEAARSINAEAFTAGQDIAFAEGNYRPNTSEGKELLAHELTHFVQQRGGSGGASVRRVQRQATGESKGGGGTSGGTSGKGSPDVPLSAAREAVLSTLRQNGLEPPEGGSLDEYVKVDASHSDRSKDWTTYVNIYLGPNNQPVPKYEYNERKMAKKRIEMGNRTTIMDVVAVEGNRVPASKRLEFEIHKYPDGTHDVVTRTVNARNAVIQKQAYTEGTRRGGPNLPNVVERGFNNLGVSIGQPMQRREPSTQEETPGQSEQGQPTGDTGGSGPDGPDKEPKQPAGAPSKAGSGRQTPDAGTTGTSARGQKHEVNRGETLWGLAEQYYGDGRKWPVIYQANTDVLGELQANEGREKPDPDLVKPGMTLQIPPKSEAESFDRSQYTPPSSYGTGQGPF